MGQVTHEIRNIVNTAILAFDMVKRGTVGVNGNTGAVLGRSLTGLRDLVDSTLSDIRTAASHQRPELISVSAFLSDIAVAAALQAEYSGLQFTSEPIDRPRASDEVDDHSGRGRDAFFGDARSAVGAPLPSPASNRLCGIAY
jgi:hypothetical protein